MFSMILFEFSGLSFVGMPRTVKFLSLFLLCFVRVVKIIGFVKGSFN